MPVLTVMLLLSTPSRAVINRADLQWGIIFWYALGATIGASLGAVVFLSLPACWLLKAIGVFLLLAAFSRYIPGGKFTITDHRMFAVVGDPRRLVPGSLRLMAATRGWASLLWRPLVQDLGLDEVPSSRFFSAA